MPIGSLLGQITPQVQPSMGVGQATVLGDVEVKTPLRIDMTKIGLIESSWNPSAVSEAGAIGLYGIMPEGARGALDDWNQLHPEERHTNKDLYKPNINFKVSDWYWNTRIPQMLNYFDISDTVENRIVAYNAGINYLMSGLQIPKETQDYIRKYKEGL